MSAITPDSYIKLVRFDVTKEHQLTFSTLSAQTDYFTNLSGLELNASTYQRKDNKVRFPSVIDSIENYNYLIYKNDSDTTSNYYQDKYFYCYITDMEYINDNMTEITIKLDVFQTYQFDFIYKRMFVEREHTNDDSLGSNRIPEGLETGEYIPNTFEDFTELNKYVYMLQVTKEYNSPYKIILGTKISGVWHTGRFYILLSYQDVLDAVQHYTTTSDLGIECIISLYVIPYNITDMSVEYPTPPSSGIIEVADSDTLKYMTKSISKPSSIDGYTPINKKLLTAEYNYMVVSNNNGLSNQFFYENFNGNSCNFSIVGVPTMGCSINLTPTNYGNGSGFLNDVFCLSGGKFPQTDYIKDNYEIWLRQNAINLNLGIIGGIAQATIGTAFLTGGDLSGVSNVGSGIGGILGTMKQVFLHSRIPPTSAGNVNTSDLKLSLQKNTFTFTQMCVTSHYARKIDKFFSMYGYKTNDVKIPNITGRLNWNYVKTIGAIVESTSVPEKYLNEYKEMLNNGITFWHNSSTFLDYSQSNSIV